MSAWASAFSGERLRPVIALVGRPNVGKSTLFNRLLGARQAVVSTSRGTTRDRLYGQLEWRGQSLTLIDTGGFEFDASGSIGTAVQRHVQQALKEADGFLLVCDAQQGLVPADQMIMERLRKMGKPVVLAVNKLDHRPAVPPDFFSLGPAQPLAISALHGRGTGDLLDHLLKTFQALRQEPPCSDSSAFGLTTARGGPGSGPHWDAPRQPPSLVSVAIIGRQNVGKSSLLNALLREDRVIVSEIPGTTRDAVDTRLVVNGTPICLIDTAGLRHRRKVRDPVDLFSMARSREAIGRCNVALVVLDGTTGVTTDDLRNVTQVCDAGRGLILLVNKWDLVKGGSERRLTDAVHRAIPFATFAPVLAVSAKTGFHLPRVLTATLRVARAMRQGLADIDCVALLMKAWATHAPPRFRGRAIRLQSACWLPGHPVRVELITRPIGRLPAPYQHYLLKRFHEHPKLSGVPIRLIVKEPAGSR